LLVKVKDSSVNIDGLKTEIVSKFADIDHVFKQFGVEAVATSGKDGVHGRNSKHYEGLALDLRTWHVLGKVVELLKQTLGEGYDVVLEKDHIHVEYDPKN
jgi:hypothetical protein